MLYFVDIDFIILKVGFIDNSFGFNVWSKKKYHKKQQMDYGERCERGDRVGMWFDWKKRRIFYFRNGESLGCAFSDIDLGKTTDKWFFVVSLYNENDVISIVQDAERPMLKEEEEQQRVSISSNSISSSMVIGNGSGQVVGNGNAVAHRGNTTTGLMYNLDEDDNDR